MNYEISETSKENPVITRNSEIVIVMADDDEDDQMLAADALRECNLPNALTPVGDGEELMDYLYHRGKYAPPVHSPRPGLVLLDLNMPRMDGAEALREMKADPTLRTIPVVVLTTSRADRDIELTYGLGANSFIVKSVTFEDLVKVMKAVMEYWLQVVELPAESKAF